MNDIWHRWWSLRCWIRHQPERLAWWLAFKLPRRVALFAFVRVYSAWGECGPDYDHVYKAWEASTPPVREPETP